MTCYMKFKYHQPFFSYIITVRLNNTSVTKSSKWEENRGNILLQQYGGMLQTFQLPCIAQVTHMKQTFFALLKNTEVTTKFNALLLHIISVDDSVTIACKDIK